MSQKRIAALPRETAADDADLIVLDGAEGVRAQTVADFKAQLATAFAGAPSTFNPATSLLGGLVKVNVSDAPGVTPIVYKKSEIDAKFTTIYATDSAYGAVGDYTGDMATAGTGTLNRTMIQAALDAGRVLGSGGFASKTTGYSTKVKLPRGRYLIDAPSDGNPSLVVPAKVEFDFSEAELYFRIPARNYTANGITEPNPAWCGILVGAQASVNIGRMQIEWGTDQTYNGQWYGMTLDAIRVYDSDISYIRGGLVPHHIFNWRGAGIRYIACYNAKAQDVSIANCAYGIVMGYFGNAFPYTRYRGNTDSEKVSTSMWLHGCSFLNIYRAGVYVGASHDWKNPALASSVIGGLETIVLDGRSQNGGPISINQCYFERIAFGAIYAYCPTGALLVSDCRFEECDDATTSQGVIYGNCSTYKVDGFDFGCLGTAQLTKANYNAADSTVTCNPSPLFRCDGINVAPHLKNMDISNFADTNAKLVSLSSQARLPALEHYKTTSSTMMQGTDSTVKNIIFPNDGGRIWSVSTVGLTPTESVNGSLKAFTFTNGLNPQKPTYLVVDGVVVDEKDTNDTVTNWTWNSTTGVVTLGASISAPTKKIRAFF